MVRFLQPSISFKSIEGTYSRDPQRLGRPCSLSPNGRFIFSISDAAHDHDIPPLSSASVHKSDGTLLSSLKCTSLVNSGSLSGDGTVALAGLEDGQLHLWNAHTGHILADGKVSDNAFCDISLSPSAENFASTAFNDDTVRLWDTTSLRTIHQFPSILDQPARGGLVSIQPDARKVSVCDYTRVHMLDCSMQKEAYSLSVSDMGVKGSFISACATDRYGRTLAAVHWPPNQICLWDLRTRKIRTRIKLAGNEGLSTICMSPDGGRIVTSLYTPDVDDRMVAVVDVSSERLTHRLRHSDDRTICTDLSADGKTVATLSKDGITRVFGLRGPPRRVFDKLDLGPPGSKVPLGSDVRRLYMRFMDKAGALPDRKELLEALARTERGHAVQGIKDMYCAHILVRTVMAQERKGGGKKDVTESFVELMWKMVYRRMPTVAGKFAGRRLIVRQILTDANKHGLLGEAGFKKLKTALNSLPTDRSAKADVRPFLKSMHEDIRIEFGEIGNCVEMFKTKNAEGKKSEVGVRMAEAMIPVFMTTYHCFVKPAGPLLLCMDLECVAEFLTKSMGFRIDNKNKEISTTDHHYDDGAARTILNFLFSERYFDKYPVQKSVNFKEELQQNILKQYESLSTFRSDLKKM